MKKNKSILGILFLLLGTAHATASAHAAHPIVELFSGQGASGQAFWAGPTGRFASEDGRFFLMNIADKSGHAQIYLVDILSHQLTLVSQNKKGEAGNDDSWRAEMSRNGERVLYASDASNVDGLNDHGTKAMIFDAKLGYSYPFVKIASGELLDTYPVDLSGDGSTALISSMIPLFAKSEKLSYNQLFAVDIAAQSPTMVTTLESGTYPPSDCTGEGLLSDSGRQMVFTSSSWLLDMSNPRFQNFRDHLYYRNFDTAKFIGDYAPSDDSLSQEVSGNGRELFRFERTNAGLFVRRIDTESGAIQDISIAGYETERLVNASKTLSSNPTGNKLLAKVIDPKTKAYTILFLNFETGASESIYAESAPWAKGSSGANCTAQLIEEDSKAALFCYDWDWKFSIYKVKL